MRMKSVILVCIAAASFGGVVASGILISEAVIRYSANSTAGEAVRVAGLLLAIPARLSTERGPYNVVISGEGPASAKERADIATVQSSSDEAFAAAAATLKT